MQSLNFILICFQNKFTRYTKLSEFGIYFCISYFQMMLQDTVLQPILNHYISGVQNFEILYLFKVRFFFLGIERWDNKVGKWAACTSGLDCPGVPV